MEGCLEGQTCSQGSCVQQNNLEKLPFDSGKLFIVDNYLEAVGVMTALRAGVAIETVRRPITATRIIRKTNKENNLEGEKAIPLKNKK